MVVNALQHLLMNISALLIVFFSVILSIQHVKQLWSNVGAYEDIKKQKK